jgi:hypothetical protein
MNNSIRGLMAPFSCLGRFFVLDLPALVLDTSTELIPFQGGAWATGPSLCPALDGFRPLYRPL